MKTRTLGPPTPAAPPRSAGPPTPAEPSSPGFDEGIRHYYAQVLGSSADLKTGACCSPEQLTPVLRALVARVHPEVRERFYGCGVPIPPALEGATVLDLGCGTGRDCYVLAQLVGEHGRVIGVDMTPEQLEVARRYRDWHAESFGHARSNVEFHLGYMENLGALGIEADSVDVVVSNCVFNLSPDKVRLFREVFRVLRPGGELYFSDVFADRRIPATLRDDPVLVGECLAGAMYTEDLRRILARVGCADVRQVSSRPVPLIDPEVEAKIGMVAFSSRTIRALRMELEDRCEDYGQVATYLGTIEGHPHVFDLDDHHRLETGRPLRVCGNSAAMLEGSRYGAHVQVRGDRSVHFGLFDCAAGSPGSTAVDGGAGPCC